MSAQPADYVTGPCKVCHVHSLLIEGRCTTCWCALMDERDGRTYRYFVTRGNGPEQEVSKAEWVTAEREAGFNNTTGHPDEPGTAGFGTTAHGGLSGRIESLVAGSPEAAS